MDCEIFEPYADLYWREPVGVRLRRGFTVPSWASGNTILKPVFQGINMAHFKDRGRTQGEVPL